MDNTIDEVNDDADQTSEHTTSKSEQPKYFSAIRKWLFTRPKPSKESETNAEDDEDGDEILILYSPQEPSKDSESNAAKDKEVNETQILHTRTETSNDPKLNTGKDQEHQRSKGHQEFKNIKEGSSSRQVGDSGVVPRVNALKHRSRKNRNTPSSANRGPGHLNFRPSVMFKNSFLQLDLPDIGTNTGWTVKRDRWISSSGESSEDSGYSRRRKRTKRRKSKKRRR